MSEIVERTLAALPRLLSSSLLGSKQGDAGRQRMPSRAFQTLLQAVDRAQCHSEEGAIIYRELKVLKQKLDQPGASVGQLRELLPRIIFCSVLGYDVSFSLIHAVKLAQQGKGMDKRAGYLAATLLLDPGHEFAILTIGTFLRDLSSSNMLDNCLALTAAAHLVNTETIPMVLPAVLERLNHNRELVREKAIHCLHAFYLRLPSLIHQNLPSLFIMIRDKDPGVISALVNFFATVVQENAAAIQPFGLALLNILQQVREQKFHSRHNYHGIPLPWLQIKLLKILGVLGSTSHSLLSVLLPTLSQILHSVNPKELVSLAVAYQCLQTISVLVGGNNLSEKLSKSESEDLTAHGYAAAASTPAFDYHHLGIKEREESASERDIRPGNVSQSVNEKEHFSDFKNKKVEGMQPLLQQASQCIARFLQSGNHNLRYIGMKSLAFLVAVNAELAVDHQMMVVRCLDDLDPAIRCQTLILLHHMANPANVQVICSKLLEHLHRHDMDRRLHQDIVEMICSIAYRLSPDPKWYLSTMLPILSLDLENHVISYAAEHMLEYLLIISQGKEWPSISPFIFRHMLTAVQATDSRIPFLQFAFSALRFLPLKHDIPEKVAFLHACTRILQIPNNTFEMKKDVVLCVQHLLLKGMLDGDTVLDWVRKTEEETSNLYPKTFRQVWKELSVLASLTLDIQQRLSFSLADLLQYQIEMDFKLTFADTYVCEVLESGQPLLKLYSAAKVTDDTDDDLHLVGQNKQPSDTSSLSSTSSGQGVNGNHGGTDQTIQGTSSPQLEVALKNIPGYKRVWSKQGILTNEAETQSSSVKPSSLTSMTANIGDKNPLAVNKSQKQQEVAQKEADLAKALFEGVTSSSHARHVKSLSVVGNQGRENNVTTEDAKDAVFEEDWAATVSYLPKAASSTWRTLHDSFKCNEQSKNTDFQGFPEQVLEPFSTSGHSNHVAESKTLDLRMCPSGVQLEKLKPILQDAPETFYSQHSESKSTLQEMQDIMDTDSKVRQDNLDARLLHYLKTDNNSNSGEHVRRHDTSSMKAVDMEMACNASSAEEVSGVHLSFQERGFQSELIDFPLSTSQRNLCDHYLPCDTESVHLTCDVEELSDKDNGQVKSITGEKVSQYSECID